MSDIGFIDNVNEYMVEGWVYSELAENRPLSLLIGGIPIRTHRPDFSSKAEIGRQRFKFPIGKKLCQKLPAGGRVSVVDMKTGHELPFKDSTVCFFPGGATDQGESLKAMLDSKWSIDHWGNLHTTFGRDPELLGRCLEIYQLGRELISKTIGQELYVTGGNLLGLIREGKFLDHDDDIDASYVIKEESTEAAVDVFFATIPRFARVAQGLGLQIRIAHAMHFYVIKPGLPYLDVLVSMFDSSGYWLRPSGYGGFTNLAVFDYRFITYSGEVVVVPLHAERELELTYGSNWQLRDQYYSKVRPEKPLAKVHAFQWQNKGRVARVNSKLDELFGS